MSIEHVEPRIAYYVIPTIDKPITRAQIDAGGSLHLWTAEDEEHLVAPEYTPQEPKPGWEWDTYVGTKHIGNVHIIGNVSEPSMTSPQERGKAWLGLALAVIYFVLGFASAFLLGALR